MPTSNMNAPVGFVAGQETISNASQYLEDMASFTADNVGDAARLVLVCRDQDINVRWDGTAPTTAIGHVVASGDTFILEGNENIVQFQVIRNATNDATVFFTLET